MPENDLLHVASSHTVMQTHTTVMQTHTDGNTNRNPNLWPFDLKVNECADTNIDTVTDATDHPTQASTTASSNKVYLKKEE